MDASLFLAKRGGPNLRTALMASTQVLNQCLYVHLQEAGNELDS